MSRRQRRIAVDLAMIAVMISVGFFGSRLVESIIA